MNILLPEIDVQIVHFSELKELVNLIAVNSYFNKIISAIPIVAQWRTIRYDRIVVSNNIILVDVAFTLACVSNFLEYTNYLIKTTNVVIDKFIFARITYMGYFEMAKMLVREVDFKDYFRKYNHYFSYCVFLSGNKEFVRWFIDLYMSYYIKIDIDSIDSAFHSCLYTSPEYLTFLIDIGKSYGHTINFQYSYYAKGIFIRSCIIGNLDVTKWLLELSYTNGFVPIDIRYNNDEVFRTCCEYGQLGIAKWLLELSYTYGLAPIDICAGNNYAFRWCCRNGHIEFAKWLVELGEATNNKIDIHAKNNYAFKHSHKNGHRDLALWLVSLNDLGYGKIIMQSYKKRKSKYVPNKPWTRLLK